MYERKDIRTRYNVPAIFQDATNPMNRPESSEEVVVVTWTVTSQGSFLRFATGSGMELSPTGPPVRLRTVARRRVGTLLATSSGAPTDDRHPTPGGVGRHPCRVDPRPSFLSSSDTPDLASSGDGNFPSLLCVFPED